MVTVHKIYPVGFASNSYLLTADGKHAVCIDPAQPRVLDKAQELGLSVEFVLLTHGHFDHIGGCAALQAAGAKVGCLAEEKKLALGADNLALEFGGEEVPPFTIDFTFSDGEELTLAGIPFKVIATPGHTAGGACYQVEDKLFTGDTLFAGDIGRTDLPTGNQSALVQSVKRLYAFNDDYTVFAGHGEDSTLNEQRKHNRYVRA
ncbi:MAG: MBL fold metallo-hydrolase [Clostridia bacterium]|nr:MBL fold metallo-hydrolase [Clostridia bacterium]